MKSLARIVCTLLVAFTIGCQDSDEVVIPDNPLPPPSGDPQGTTGPDRSAKLPDSD